MQLNGLPGETVVKKTHSVPKRLKGGGGTLNCRLVGFFSGVLSGTFFYDRGLSFYIGVGGFYFLSESQKIKAPSGWATFSCSRSWQRAPKKLGLA